MYFFFILYFPVNGGRPLELHISTCMCHLSDFPNVSYVFTFLLVTCFNGAPPLPPLPVCRVPSGDAALKLSTLSFHTPLGGWLTANFAKWLRCSMCAQRQLQIEARV